MSAPRKAEDQALNGAQKEENMTKKSRTLGKFLAALLALTLCVSLAVPTFAAGPATVLDLSLIHI